MDIKVRKPRSVDREAVGEQVLLAIKQGYCTREQIEIETRLNEDVIADALAELYDTSQIRIVSGHYYLRAKAA